MRILSWNIYWEGLVAYDNKCVIPELLFETHTEQLVSFDNEKVKPSKLKRSLNENIEHLNQINSTSVDQEYMKNIKNELKNIEQKISIYNKKDSKCRENILDKINEIHASNSLDFICLQEASNLFVNEIPLFDRPFLNNFTPIFYKLENSTLITLINKDIYEIIDKHEWGFSNSRPFLIVKVKNRTTNKFLYIINVHLPHTENQLGDTTTLSFIDNLKYAISILKSKFKLTYNLDGIIVAGDFNDIINKKLSLYGINFDYEENSPPGVGETYKIVKERGMSIQKIQPIGTCCYDVNGDLNSNAYDYKPYDHILINDKLKYTGLNYPIKPEVNKLFSDHLPLLATIEFKELNTKGGYYEKYLKYRNKYFQLKNKLKIEI